MKRQKIHNSQHSIEEKHFEGLTLPNNKIFYEAKIIKTVVLVKEYTNRSMK